MDQKVSQPMRLLPPQKRSDPLQKGQIQGAQREDKCPFLFFLQTLNLIPVTACIANSTMN